MTRFRTADGRLLIKWDAGDPVDWTTPDVGDGISDEYCGNCGLDVPGCGCPRDDHYDADQYDHPVKAADLPVQAREDEPLPYPAEPAP